MSRLKKVLLISLILLIIGGVFAAVFWPEGETEDPPRTYIHFTYTASNSGHFIRPKNVQGATVYEVFLEGDLLEPEDDGSYDITKFLTVDDKYAIQITAYDNQSEMLKDETEEYHYKAKYANDFKRCNFYINGQKFSYCITTAKQLQMLVHHTILYQNNNVRFYINVSSINSNNIDYIVSRYIYDPSNSKNSYPEYDGIKNFSATHAVYESSRVAKLVNFTYFLDSDHLLTTANWQRSQLSRDLVDYRNTYNQPIKDHSFDTPYETAASSGERNFAIDEEGLLEIEVYNAEQLFNVVQYGAKPVFTEQSSEVVVTIWENARAELALINNSDYLTDYQKALNIYRYIVQNVTYDHVLFGYMDYVNDSTVSRFGNFNVFYLESVFYDLDNQISVCDGLSKAYALMCNIEGIGSTKINGKAGFDSKGEHAWNKVKIDDSWFIVDTTWGINYYQDSNQMYEFATHSYFLVSQNSITSSHSPSYEIGTEATKHYNYFGKTQVSYNGQPISFYVETLDQINNLISYAAENDLSGLEIMISGEFKNAYFSYEYDAVYRVWRWKMKQSLIDGIDDKARVDYWMSSFTSDGNYVYFFLN